MSTRESASPSTTLPDRDHEQRRHRAPAGRKPATVGADREPVDEQRARVVEQALALENHQHPVRRAELPEHRRRGRRVGRRHDRAERDRRRPGHVRARASARRRRRRRGEPDRAEGQAGDRAPVRARSRGEESKAASSSTGATNSASASSGSSVQRRRVRDQRERGAGQRDQGGVGRAERRATASTPRRPGGSAMTNPNTLMRRTRS